MSWLKGVSACGDDVFDDNADVMSVISHEWASNMKRRVRDGYVDGADAGTEAALQAGFNQGYREGAAVTALVGRLKGMLSGLYFWYQTKHPESPVPPPVMELLDRLSKYESAVVEGISRALEKPPADISSVSETMEELDLQQPQSACCGGGSHGTECCKGAEKVDLKDTNAQKRLSSGAPESLSWLLQRCIDLVSELGLPQELSHHMEELKSVESARNV